MHFIDNIFGAAVAVGVTGQYFLIALHQHIIDAPCVDRKALDLRIFLPRPFNADLNMSGKCFDIPYQMTVTFRNTVRETVDFFGFDRTAILPTDNVSAGGRANVDCKIILHLLNLLYIVLSCRERLFSSVG